MRTFSLVLFLLSLTFPANAEMFYYQHRSGSTPLGANYPGVTWGQFQSPAESGFLTRLGGTSEDHDSAILTGGTLFREGNKAPQTEEGIFLGEMEWLHSAFAKMSLVGGPAGDQALYTASFHAIHEDFSYEVDLLLRTGMTLSTPDTPAITVIDDAEGKTFPSFSFRAIVQLSGDPAKDSAVVFGATTKDRTVLVRKGDPAPGSDSTFADFQGLASGDGPVAFGATLAGDADLDPGLWRQLNGKTFGLVARRGDAVAAFPGSVFGRFDFKDLASDADSGLLFKASLNDDPSSAAAIWHWQNGAIRLVARPGDPAGGGDVFSGFQSLGLDEIGSAYFRASLNDGADSGIYVRTRQGQLKRMLRSGQTIQYRRAGEAELSPKVTVTSIGENLSFFKGFVYVVATLDGTESSVLMMLDRTILDDFGPQVTVFGPKRISTRRALVRLRGKVSGPRPIQTLEVDHAEGSRKGLGLPRSTRVRFSKTTGRWTARIDLRGSRRHELTFFAWDVKGYQSMTFTTVKVRRITK